ncbi:MAG: sigma-70 family RNA polymerase sigma factor [Phycisphaerae bacterium]|nr:sigma-70 family RNA polymerase sigma factor [Phycisphaerae bacterium]
MDDAEGQPDDLLIRMKDGDEQALAELFSMHRDRLWRMVHFRLDHRLRGRVDADDVLQEAYLEAAKRVEHFVDDSTTSFFVWLRMVVSQTLIDVHRRHLGAKMRDAGREVPIHGPRYPQATTVSLAIRLMGHLTSPSQAAMREEMYSRLEATLDEMDPIDREVLALRHFEELTNSEVAEVLGIQQKAASIRYIRAVKRLKDILSQMPGFFDVSHGG